MVARVKRVEELDDVRVLRVGEHVALILDPRHLRQQQRQQQQQQQQQPHTRAECVGGLLVRKAEFVRKDRSGPLVGQWRTGCALNEDWRQQRQRWQQWQRWQRWHTWFLRRMSPLRNTLIA